MSTLARLLSRTGTLVLTLGFMGGSLAAVAGTALFLAGRAESLPPPPVPDPVPVRVTVPDPRPGYTLTRRFAGRIAPAETTALGFESGGRIEAILPREGDRVAAGEVVARLDTRALAADLAAATADRNALTAMAELARITLGRQAGLTAKGHAATRQLDEARLDLARLEAQVAAASARIEGIAIALDKAVLRAPFTAEIGTRHLDPGATVAAGSPVLTLLSLAPPELRAGLPPDLAATLAPGQAMTVETGGRTLAVRLVRLRPDLSAATGTREAVLALDLPDGAAPPWGDSATLLVPQSVEVPGFWLPLPALRDGPRGTWAVMLAEPGPGGLPVARPEAVEVLHAEGSRAFLRGALPPGVPVLAEGGHRVTPGQPLAPLTD